MNKKELGETVSKERNLTKKDAEILVDTVFMMIIISECKYTKIPENTHYPNYRKNE